MTNDLRFRVFGGTSWRKAAGFAALLLTIPACGGAPAAALATGKVGRDVSARADHVPQGAEVCALKDALAAPGGGPDKPTSETCAKAMKSDQLWQKSMVVLGAYADTLDGLASGGSAETTGPLEAALTGVRGSDWIDVEDGPEKAAREAVAQLVDQMKNGSAKGDLEKAVKDAAPHVKTVCDGLLPYLETQAKSLVDMQKEIEKRRANRNDRRCGALDNRPVCVNESATDRVVYASAYAQVESLATAHADAHALVSGFCAAHRKLEDAAAKGDLKSKSTYVDVVDAVRAARRQESDAAADAKAGAAPKK